MNTTTTYPDYNNCITGIPSSILKYYGISPSHNTLPDLDKALSGDYRNVLFIIYDGMGMDMLSDNLQDTAFLRKNIVSRISTVFPSTTVAGLTSYFTARTPIEHGWLGWSLFFKEYQKQIDVFTDREARTGNPSGYQNTAKTMMPYDSIFEKIESSNNGVRTYSITHRGIDRPSTPETVIGYDSLADMHKVIRNLCDKPDSKFILAYHKEPDYLSHKKGCRSRKIRKILKKINKSTEQLCKRLNDTLVIISADHGHIDINKDIFLEEIPELAECLMIPPSVEARAVSIFVKPGTEEKFKEAFNRILGNDFILFTRKEVFDGQLFGLGEPHAKSQDFIGDFIAAAKGQALLRYRIPDQKDNIKFASHHAGLTAAEMYVPLIIYET